MATFRRFGRGGFLPKEEFEIRYAKARELMEKKGLDALLVTSPSNYRYFAGIVYDHGPRRSAFILPIDRDPVILVNSVKKHDAEKQTYIDDVRWYYHPFQSSMIVNILTDLGLDSRARIGAELKHGYMTNIPYEVKELVPDDTFVDATDILKRLRMIKTKNEVEAIRDVCLRHTTAMLKMLEKIRGGMTLMEIDTILTHCHVDEGVFPRAKGSTLYEIWNPDGKGEWRRMCYDINRKLRKGDYVNFDHAVTGTNGYHADFGATFVVGEPTMEHQEWWDKCIYITKKWMEISKPGFKMSEAHKKACDAVRDVGLDPADYIGCHAIKRPHYAHGTGLDTVEEPFATPDEQMKFESGMTLCIEPALHGREGEGAPKSMHREEEIVITRDGYERLTTMGWKLHSIAEK